MRTKIVAGNWKMNLSFEEASVLSSNITSPNSPNVKIIIFPSFPYLSIVKENCQRQILVGAQNCSQFDNGAYTGEVSASILKSIDISWVLVGHSERRLSFHEKDQILAQKVNAALNAGMNVVFCCGEMLEIRERGLHIEFVKEQLRKALFHLPVNEWSRITIAYEPIWAIGTGVTASPDQAQEMHHEIRSFIEKNIGFEVADQIKILYGGSVTSSNAGSLFSMEDIDGALVGGASLSADSFNSIIQAAVDL